MPSFFLPHMHTKQSPDKRINKKVKKIIQIVDTRKEREISVSSARQAYYYIYN